MITYYYYYSELGAVDREFTKGGLIKGGLAMYVLSLYHHCQCIVGNNGIMITHTLLSPPLSNPALWTPDLQGILRVRCATALGSEPLVFEVTRQRNDCGGRSLSLSLYIYIYTHTHTSWVIPLSLSLSLSWVCHSGGASRMRYDARQAAAVVEQVQQAMTEWQLQLQKQR